MASYRVCRCDMFKVIALIVVGIFLMTFGTYFLSIADLSVLQLPKIDVNWAVVGFVAIVGSIVTFGSAFAVSRLA
jgi:Zn-dependent protease with chaperone function